MLLSRVRSFYFYLSCNASTREALVELGNHVLGGFMNFLPASSTPISFIGCVLNEAYFRHYSNYGTIWMRDIVILSSVMLD